MSTAGSWADEYRRYIGQRVRIVMRGQDNFDGVPDVELKGEVYALAVREAGGSLWRGTQYDMVLDRTPDHVVRTFALSRIKSITVIDTTGSADQ